MYTQMARGLSQRLKVLRVGAVFASGLLRAIRFLQLHWEQLAAHIEAGRLIPRRTRPSASGGGRAPAPGLDLDLVRFLQQATTSSTGSYRPPPAASRARPPPPMCHTTTA
ncbi:hypothetical protein BS78_10G141600 [Paspalum vaginatum]|nr:hypothetical protein BS78_10G141600 [Paspalum vaginatum]